jgi:hypothetical protein
MLYLLVSASLWQLVSWRRTGRPWSLIVAGALAGGAVSAKTNGFVMVAVFVIALALAVVRPRDGEKRWPRGATAAVGVLAALVGFWVAVVGYYKGWTTHPDFHSIGDNLGVNNTFADFVTLHLNSFFPSPWVNHEPSHARDEFWNYLLRSSLFGEFGSEEPTTRGCAYVLIAFTLAFYPFVAAGLVASMVRGLRRDDVGHRELALTLLGFLGFLAAFRLVFPYCVHNDFRFGLPMILPGSVMAAMSVGWLRRRLARSWPHLAALPAWLVVTFCVVAVRISVFWS